MPEADFDFAEPSNARMAASPADQQESGVRTKYWTWTTVNIAGNSHWAAVCIWPQDQLLPHIEHNIEVHHTDGSAQSRTIASIEDISYADSGDRKVVCLVRR